MTSNPRRNGRNGPPRFSSTSYKDGEITYAELAKRLKKHGFKEKPKRR